MFELSVVDLCSLGVGGCGGDSKSHIIDKYLKVGGGVCLFKVLSFDLQDVGRVLDACFDPFWSAITRYSKSRSFIEQQVQNLGSIMSTQTRSGTMMFVTTRR